MRQKTVFCCSECGNETVKWSGRCTACGAWDSLVEVKLDAKSKGSTKRATSKKTPKLISELDTEAELRFSTGIGELDRVLGGGAVKGSLVLVGGAPGIGKSTLLLQLCGLVEGEMKILYVTGEESERQLKMRAQRLGVDNGQIYVLAETGLTEVLEAADELEPDIMIVDSIQTMFDSEVSSAPGSVSQVRECTMSIMRMTKEKGFTTFVVGHINKEGNIAGPKVLEHMVDCVLYFEGERSTSFRILRAGKNRFGSTNEIGIFEMQQTGMKEADNTAALFVSGGNDEGCAVTCIMEGNRPIPVEVQSLLITSAFANARRIATGMDTSRLILLLAVLERRAGIRVSDKDVYTNAVGGIRLDDRGADLALALAVAGSVLGKMLPDGCIAIGEISLTGEIRPADRMLNRIQECIRLGYSEAVIPYSSSLNSIKGIKLHKVKYLRDAIAILG